MSDQQNWAEALNISPDQLAEWSAQAPAGKPLLVYCLEQGLVDYGEYMRWAQNAFGLAVLQPHFFQGTFDVNDLEKARMTGDWHPWRFPVAHWDGVTFVACVEPGAESASDTRFVLADPRAMREAWGGTFTSIRPVPKTEHVANEEPPPLTAEAMPEGLSAAPQPFVLDLDEAIFNIGPVTQIKETPKEESRVEEIKEDSRAGISILSELPEAPLAKPPPAPPAKTELKVVAEASVPKPKKPAPASEDAAITELFNSLCERFEHAFLMKIEGQDARLYKHDSMLNPSAPDKAVVNLSYPTFMRIVSRTGQPYHGYLVSSPAHQELFAALGYQNLPTSVTAVPIKFDAFLWGFVVCIGNQDNQKLESLTYAQERVEKLTDELWDFWAKAA